MTTKENRPVDDMAVIKEFGGSEQQNTTMQIAAPAYEGHVASSTAPYSLLASTGGE